MSNVRYNFDDAPNFPEVIMYDFYKSVWRKYDERLKNYLKENLKRIGHEFNSDAELFEFCRNRVQKIGFDYNPNYYEFYVDYVDNNNRGKFIGSVSDKINIETDGNKITATIG